MNRPGTLIGTSLLTIIIVMTGFIIVLLPRSAAEDAQSVLLPPRAHSPHWDHIRILDFSRSLPYITDPQFKDWPMSGSQPMSMRRRSITMPLPCESTILRWSSFTIIWISQHASTLIAGGPIHWKLSPSRKTTSYIFQKTPGYALPHWMARKWRPSTYPGVPRPNRSIKHVGRRSSYGVIVAGSSTRSTPVFGIGRELSCFALPETEM